MIIIEPKKLTFTYIVLIQYLFQFAKSVQILSKKVLSIIKVDNWSYK
jgi:hypothetical protein